VGILEAITRKGKKRKEMAMHWELTCVEFEKYEKKGEK